MINKKIIASEDGQGLVEYVLIISLVAVVVILALTFFGTTVKNHYNNTTERLSMVSVVLRVDNSKAGGDLKGLS